MKEQKFNAKKLLKEIKNNIGKRAPDEDVVREEDLDSLNDMNNMNDGDDAEDGKRANLARSAKDRGSLIRLEDFSTPSHKRSEFSVRRTLRERVTFISPRYRRFIRL